MIKLTKGGIYYMNYKLLENKFPALQTYTGQLKDAYIFKFEDQLYEIPKTAITKKEYEILSIFSEKIDIQSDLVQNWIQFLEGKTTNPPIAIASYQLLLIRFPHEGVNYYTIESVFNALLKEQIILINPEKKLYCILLSTDSKISLKPFIQLISNDLQVSCKILVSDLQTNILNAPALYTWLQTIEKNIWFLTNQQILEQEDLLIPLLIMRMTEYEKDYFVHHILQQAVYEKELLKTVQYCIECQNNFSAAAKKLFIHRNTLQKRLDKFYNLTNKDLKNFKEVLEVYFAILSLNQTSNLHTPSR